MINKKKYYMHFVVSIIVTKNIVVLCVYIYILSVINKFFLKEVNTYVYFTYIFSVKKKYYLHISYKDNHNILYVLLTKIDSQQR